MALVISHAREGALARCFVRCGDEVLGLCGVGHDVESVRVQRNLLNLRDTLQTTLHLTKKLGHLLGGLVDLSGHDLYVKG